MAKKIYLKIPRNLSTVGVRSVFNELTEVQLVNNIEDADHIIDLNDGGTKLLFDIFISKKEEFLKQRDSQEELKAILQSSTEGIEAIDIDGNVKYVNPAFLRITNIEASERVNQNIFERNPNGLLAKVIKHGQPLHNVKTHAPGSGVEAIASATPVYNNDEMIGAVIVVSDISNTIRIGKELERSQSKLNTLYEKISNSGYKFDSMIGGSDLLSNTIEDAKQFSNSSSTILITGESGTGKELFAQAIYNYSNQNGPFIAVNCAAIPSQLLESELFGHEKGSFTGADKQRVGMFELAQNGTIFLDEIGELELPLQAKLLRVLQENEFRRVGGNKILENTARIIAATNRPLLEMVEKKSFRKDLYYRLNVLELYIPPLRNRKEDITPLVDMFIKKYNQKLNKYIKGITDTGMESLIGYDWPGNIRELENVIERAINISKQPYISKSDLFNIPDGQEEHGKTFIPTSLEEVEEKVIRESLSYFGNDLKGKKQAAKVLGISLSNLYNKLKYYNKDSSL